ncbi:GNAT family N-acetyltransferase [Paenibacillus riograndensis]|uniref:GNAT family N-acetyltransferase n=1 Tax=Paenibacillus riograndensis TaxID=483937 RepID=UPI0009E8780D|nr:GNAT family N-acetyltransferase [Paenibacillus riograndensis]
MNSCVIYDLLQNSFSEYVHSDIYPSALLYSVDQISRTLNRWLLLYEQNEAIACVQWEASDGVYTFSHMAVHPSHRRLGAGGRLVRMVEEKARSQGAILGLIAVRMSLYQNVSFVESLGYEYDSVFDEAGIYGLFKKVLEE